VSEGGLDTKLHAEWVVRTFGYQPPEEAPLHRLGGLLPPDLGSRRASSGPSSSKADACTSSKACRTRDSIRSIDARGVAFAALERAARVPDARREPAEDLHILALTFHFSGVLSEDQLHQLSGRHR
jgi:hypothetical protein